MSGVTQQEIDGIGNLLLDVRCLLDVDFSQVQVRTTDDPSLMAITSLKRLHDSGYNACNLVTLFESDIKEMCKEAVTPDALNEGSVVQETRIMSIVYSIATIAHMSFDSDARLFVKGFLMPSVYSDLFLLHQIIPLVILLLDRTEDSAAVNVLSTKKGLFLLRHVLSLVGPTSLSCKSFPKNFYDFLRMYPVHVILPRVIQYCTEESLRQEAYTLFKRILSSFSKEEKTDMIDVLINTPSQVPGIVELAINEYRSSLTAYPTTFLSKKHFAKTVRTLIILSHINSNSNDSLIDRMEIILSLLNFVRFFCLWDQKDINQTGIWDLSQTLMNDFVLPLKNRCNAKKSSLMKQLKELKTEDDRSRQQRLDDARKLKILNQSHADELESGLPQDFAEIGIHKVLTTVNMIESVADIVHAILSPNSC